MQIQTKKVAPCPPTLLTSKALFNQDTSWHRDTCPSVSFMQPKQDCLTCSNFTIYTNHCEDCAQNHKYTTHTTSDSKEGENPNARKNQ